VRYYRYPVRVHYPYFIYFEITRQNLCINKAIGETAVDEDEWTTKYGTAIALRLLRERYYKSVRSICRFHAADSAVSRRRDKNIARTRARNRIATRRCVSQIRILNFGFQSRHSNLKSGNTAANISEGTNEPSRERRWRNSDTFTRNDSARARARARALGHVDAIMCVTDTMLRGRHTRVLALIFRLLATMARLIKTPAEKGQTNSQG